MPATPGPDRFLVPPDRLRRRADLGALGFETTADVPPLEGTIGQPRAMDALEFGLENRARGYHLYVSGPPGSGRLTTVRDYLERYARGLPTSVDWVYVHNFEEVARPRPIRLPAGMGRRLAADIDGLIEAARQHLGRAFQTERYDQRRREALAELSARREAILEEVQQFAKARGFALEPTPGGLVAIPVADGRPIPPDELGRLPKERQEELSRRGEEVQQHVIATLRTLRQLEIEAGDRVRALDREVALFTIDPLFQHLRETYAELPEVLAHLEAIRSDLPDHLGDFRPEAEVQADHQPAPATLRGVAFREEHVDRYRVNVLVDNDDHPGVPIVHERNPTHANLIGRVEYRATFGMLTTDFRQIRAGALHRANGGFLVMDAVAVLSNPFAWDGLKRALGAGEIRIENPAEQLTMAPTGGLQPDPIPLDLKVVLIGSARIHQLLSTLDDDFRELFKVRVDFAPDMAWDDESAGHYAAFISRVVRDGGLRHFDRGAVARVVEHGARLREHQGRLSTRLLEISDLVTEASFWAGRRGSELVGPDDVVEAIRRREYRSNLAEERIQEMIGEGTIRIDVAGEQVGQVNGLSVVMLGDHAFGMPARVTATVALGRGSVDSIEREIDLSGPIHSKGVLTISGYLAQTYGQEAPLAIRATLTFEQQYDGVDGDSASSTELYALLSALSGLPLRQSIAVTGSVDQRGVVQAVGGVSHKIEGFFAVCRRGGLTGDQGVMMPATNVPHLMLSDEVIEAVREGRFRIWAVSSIDEGIEVLTGHQAGSRDSRRRYARDTVHGRVAASLREYARRSRAFGTVGDHRPRPPRSPKTPPLPVAEE